MSSFLHWLNGTEPEPRSLHAVGATNGTNGSAQGYAAAALAAEVAAVEDAAQGTRNATLNTAAYNLGQLVAGGHLDYHEVAEALDQAGTRAGLGDDEIGPTLRSGLTAGAKNPRNIPAPRTQEITSWAIGSAGSAGISPAGARTATATGLAADDATDGSTVEESQPADRTSWWPRPISTVVTERGLEPPPSHLARTDGHRLFYAGKVNGLLGESESGKTWVALLAVQQALEVGEAVLYLDFEDTAKGIEARLRLMGATDTHLAQLHYASPDEALGLAQHADMAEAIAAHAFTVVVLDGVNAAMTLLGLDVDSSNKDATIFTQRVLRPLANTGAAVVTIDHVPKNKDTRGKGAIGAQAKRAMTRGCALRVEVIRPFGEGMSGELKLIVDKDTAGKVRAVSSGARHAGTAHIDSTRAGQVVITIEAPVIRAEGVRFRPTHLMERVSHFLATVTDGASGSAIEDGVTGKGTFIREALDVLVEEGYVSRSSGARGALIHSPIRPYSEATDTDLVPSSRPRPSSSRDEVTSRSNDLVPSSPSLQGTRDEVISGDASSSSGDELRWDQR